MAIENDNLRERRRRADPGKKVHKFELNFTEEREKDSIIRHCAGFKTMVFSKFLG